MSRCQIKVIKDKRAIEFRVSGCIDDTLSHFSSLFSGVSDLYINLDEVTAINSFGIREWIKLMRMLKDAKIQLTHCPKLFIDQINMVNGMLPENSQILSFYVPYFSEKKNAEKKVLFEKNVHFSDKFINFNSTIAGNDGYSYDLDVIADRYFKFITDEKSGSV